MTEEAPASISRAEAIETVGTAFFGKEWIDGLSHREWWLLDSYTAELVSYPGSLPPPPPALRDELQRAVDRHAWMENQTKHVEDWLDQNLPQVAEPFERKFFDAVLARYLGAQSSELKRFNGRTAAAFVASYFETEKHPNKQGCEKAAIAAGYTGVRPFIRKAYDVHNSTLEKPVKQGRR